MGNIIVCCIKAQVQIIGVGGLDPAYTKVCTSCRARQFTSSDSCQFCGSPCVIFSSCVGTSTGQTEVPMVKEIPWPSVDAIEKSGAIAAIKRLEKLELSLKTSSKLPIKIDGDDSQIQNENISCNDGSEVVDKDGEIDIHQGLDDVEGIDDISEALITALETVTCPVCLEVYQDPSTLPCGHSFCIRHVQEVESRCPICRHSFANLNVKNVTVNGDLSLNTQDILTLCQRCSAK